MKTLFILLSLALTCAAFEQNFQSTWTMWKSPEILLAFADSAHMQVNPEDFCRALVRAEPDLGLPQCRLAGDWERDSLSGMYLRWLGNNVDAQVEARHLAARNPQVIERLHKLDDRYLIVLSEHHDSLWALLFSGNNTYKDGHSANEPGALALLFPKPKDAGTLAEDLGLAWFSESPLRRLTDNEKMRDSIAPDPSYAETPVFEYWVAVGGGWSQGNIPLTPSSWYSGPNNDHVVHYRSVVDSLTAWSFMQNKSPLVTVRAGFTWIGFVGLELSGTRTDYNMKTSPTDTLYRELDHWSYARYEAGLTAHITTHKKLSESISLNPYAFIGFNASFLVESIGLKAGVTTPSEEYQNRIHFQTYYSGALFGIGNRVVIKDNYAFDTRIGIASRGKSLDQEPSVDASRSPTVIGGATVDCFISAALEYHWLVH